MQGIIFGALLILTMLFVPRGIAGLGIKVKHSLQSRRLLESNQKLN
jgi:hypothetical protein